MTARTPEEKRQKRIETFCERMRGKSIEKIFNEPKTGLAALAQKLTRLAQADANGVCQCVTCDRQLHWKLMQGGHYVTRSNKATILLVGLNVNPQCPDCNRFNHGRPERYRAVLVERHGEANVAALESMKLLKNHSWNRYELAETKVNLLDEIKLHEKRLGI